MGDIFIDTLPFPRQGGPLTGVFIEPSRTRFISGVTSVTTELAKQSGVLGSQQVAAFLRDTGFDAVRAGLAIGNLPLALALRTRSLLGGRMADLPLNFLMSGGGDFGRLGTPSSGGGSLVGDIIGALGGGAGIGSLIQAFRGPERLPSGVTPSPQGPMLDVPLARDVNISSLFFTVSGQSERARQRITIPDSRGRLRTWGFLGTPILYTGDLAGVKRVKRISAKVNRALPRRPR